MSLSARGKRLCFDESESVWIFASKHFTVKVKVNYKNLLCLSTSRTGKNPPSRKTNPSFSALCRNNQDRA